MTTLGCLFSAVFEYLASKYLERRWKQEVEISKKQQPTSIGEGQTLIIIVVLLVGTSGNWSVGGMSW